MTKLGIYLLLSITELCSCQLDLMLHFSLDDILVKIMSESTQFVIDDLHIVIDIDNLRTYAHHVAINVIHLSGNPANLAADITDSFDDSRDLRRRYHRFVCHRIPPC